MSRSCKLSVAAVALAAIALALVVPALSGAQSENDLRSRANRARAREQGLAGDVARLGPLVSKLDGDIRGNGRGRGQGPGPARRRRGQAGEAARGAARRAPPRRAAPGAAA